MSDQPYTDDSSIPDKARLLRRIPIKPSHIVCDPKVEGGMRPSSAAFENHPDGSPMSVQLEDVLRELGQEPDSALRNHEGFALAAITAGLVRSCNQGVVRNPTGDDPAHAEVVGDKPKSVRKRLAKSAVWVVFPEVVAGSDAQG